MAGLVLFKRITTARSWGSSNTLLIWPCSRTSLAKAASSTKGSAVMPAAPDLENNLSLELLTQAEAAPDKSLLPKVAL